MKKIFLGILFFLLIFLSLFPRSIEVLNHNYVFGFDQGRDYLAVKNIVIDHKLTLIGAEIGAGAAGFQGIFQGPLYYYLLAVPFIIFQGDPYGGVVLMLLFGLGSIALGFYLGKKLFNIIGAYIIAILLAISPPLISQSRFVWNSHPSTFFVLLTFICVYFLYRRNKKLIFITSFLAGIIYHFEIAVAIPVCITIIFYCSVIIRFKSFKEYLALFSGFLTAAAPFFLFEARHKFMGIKGIIFYVFHNQGSSTGNQPSYFISHLGAFSYNFFDTFPGFHILSQLLLIGIFIVGVIYAIIIDKNEKRKKFMSFLVLLPFISFIVFLFLKNLVYPFYLIELTVAYIFLFVYLLWQLYESGYYIGLSMFSLLIVYFIINGFQTAGRVSLADYQDYGGTAKIKGKIDAIDYIYKDANGKPFGLLIFTPPVYTYDFDYVVWWDGMKKFGYAPYKDKKGVFYLLIAPDPGKPWSYKGWLETVIKIGTIEKTTQLPSGLIVQKRIAE